MDKTGNSKAKPIFVVKVDYEGIREGIANIKETISKELEHQYHVLIVGVLEKGVSFECFNVENESPIDFKQLEEKIKVWQNQ